MKSLIYLLFAQSLKGNPRNFKRNFKRKNATSINIIKNILLMVFTVISFIFKGIHSIVLFIMNRNICPNEVVEENKNIIDFSEYKIKKAK